MRTEQRTVRVGEDVGPIDWEHPLAADMPAHWGDAERHPEKYLFLENGMFTPREVFKLRMYDGWPYWKPTPAIYRESPLGGEWTFFNSYGVHHGSLFLKDSEQEGVA
jgi:hypothetical protein